MQHRFLYALCSLSIVALMFGCSKSEPLTPTIPSPPAASTSDGTTLKVTAPGLVSPVNDVRLANFTAPQLNASGVQSTQGVSVSPQYRFQLLSSSGALLQDSGLRSSTSWTPTVNGGRLQFDTRYLWQVRARTSSREILTRARDVPLPAMTSAAIDVEGGPGRRERDAFCPDRLRLG